MHGGWTSGKDRVDRESEYADDQHARFIREEYAAYLVVEEWLDERLRRACCSACFALI